MGKKTAKKNISLKYNVPYKMYSKYPFPRVLESARTVRNELKTHYEYPREVDAAEHGDVQER